MGELELDGAVVTASFCDDVSGLGAAAAAGPGAPAPSGIVTTSAGSAWLVEVNTGGAHSQLAARSIPMYPYTRVPVHTRHLLIPSPWHGHQILILAASSFTFDTLVSIRLNSVSSNDVAPFDWLGPVSSDDVAPRDWLGPGHRHGARAGAGAPLGRWVHVDPIKPTLTAPETHLLTLECDQPLPTLAFKFNLRRYTLDVTHVSSTRVGRRAALATVGRCRLILSNPR